MPYIFKQKLKIEELFGVPQQAKKIMVVEPEEDLLALYSYHLSNADFHVKPSRQVSGFYENFADFRPHLVVVNAAVCGSALATAKFLEVLRARRPGVHIVTVGYNIEPQDLKILMAVGINAHIDRRLSRPNDVVAIAKTLLEH